MVIEELNSIFIHIPKTGGTTITSELLYHAKNDFTMGKLFNFYKKNNVTGKKKNKAHVKARSYKKYLSNYDDYWKFTILRNPFGQIRSLYKQLTYMNLKINRRFKRYKNMTFEEFVMSDDEEFSMIGNKNLIRQKAFIIDKNGEILVDKIYLYDDFPEICEDLNKRFNCNINYNIKHRETFAKDLYTPDMIEKVMNNFSKEYNFYKEVKNSK